jgi:hypothetical protein
MCRVCPDNPLMNASRHVVELVGDELEQAEFEELLTLFEVPPELLEELPELVETLPELLDELPDLAETLPELLDELPELLEEPPLLEELPAGLLLAAMTRIEKAGSSAVVVPSSALMTMLEYWPVSGLLGVPESSPVVLPKLAQTGLFWMLKLSDMPLGLDTVG